MIDSLHILVVCYFVIDIELDVGGRDGALAGAAALGIGALAFYGSGVSGEMGAVEKSVMWPQYVKDRIRDTYM